MQREATATEVVSLHAVMLFYSMAVGWAMQPANILIDDDFNAKVADFGLSREVEADSNSAGIETKIKGTVVSTA